MGSMVRVTGLLLVNALGCKPVEMPSTPADEPAPPIAASTPTAEPTTAPSPDEPAAAPAPNPARPADVPPAAPATLGVNDMAGHPARWNDEAIILFARLRYRPVGCTKSVPPSCTSQWELVDADSDESMRVPLAEVGIAVPAVCRPAASSLIADSPCAPDELDPTQRYRLEGRLKVERGSTRFIPTKIEASTTP